MTGAGDAAYDGLVVRDLVVRYGGLVAVDAVSMQVPRGRVTGLIGPNGAGKTTTFNACSGLVRPAGGEIRLGGRDVTRDSVQRRAQLGLGRTFQRIELFDSLTVAQNVALGREGAMARSWPWTQAFARRGEREQVRAATEAALETCGITAYADRVAASLPTGVRRLVELARVLAGDFRVLLLDEPSSGLDNAESERFGEVLLDVVRREQLGILLVEHHMALVLDVCAHIYVLDFGRLLFEGPPDAVAGSPVVRSAYLGEAA